MHDMPPAAQEPGCRVAQTDAGGQFRRATARSPSRWPPAGGMGGAVRDEALYN